MKMMTCRELAAKIREAIAASKVCRTYETTYYQAHRKEINDEMDRLGGWIKVVNEDGTEFCCRFFDPSGSLDEQAELLETLGETPITEATLKFYAWLKLEIP